MRKKEEREKWVKCRRTMGKKSFYARPGEWEILLECGAHKIIPTKKIYGSFSGNRERRVLESLGLNVGGNKCVGRIFQRDVRGEKVESK